MPCWMCVQVWEQIILYLTFNISLRQNLSFLSHICFVNLHVCDVYFRLDCARSAVGTADIITAMRPFSRVTVNYSPLISVRKIFYSLIVFMLYIIFVYEQSSRIICDDSAAATIAACVSLSHVFYFNGLHACCCLCWTCVMHQFSFYVFLLDLMAWSIKCCIRNT